MDHGIIGITPGPHYAPPPMALASIPTVTEADIRRVDGRLSDLLTLLYSSVYVDLVESGMDSDTAGELTRKLLPRVEQRLVTHGFVSRQVGDG